MKLALILVGVTERREEEERFEEALEMHDIIVYPTNSLNTEIRKRKTNTRILDRSSRRIRER